MTTIISKAIQPLTVEVYVYTKLYRYARTKDEALPVAVIGQLVNPPGYGDKNNINATLLTLYRKGFVDRKKSPGSKHGEYSYWAILNYPKKWETK